MNCTESDLMVKEKCLSKLCKNQHNIKTVEVIKATSCLKNNRFDPIFDISSNNVINGSFKLFSMLSDIFNAMLIHGCSNEILNSSIIKPIVKDKRKSKNISNNYRGIFLSSVIMKLSK